MAAHLLLCLLLLLPPCEVLSGASSGGFNPDDFPDPTKDVALCGRHKAGRVCDPDGIMSEDGRNQAQAIIHTIETECLHDCRGQSRGYQVGMPPRCLSLTFCMFLATAECPSPCAASFAFFGVPPNCTQHHCHPTPFTRRLARLVERHGRAGTEGSKTPAPKRGSGLGEGGVRGRGALFPPTVENGGPYAGTPPLFSSRQPVDPCRPSSLIW